MMRSLFIVLFVLAVVAVLIAIDIVVNVLIRKKISFTGSFLKKFRTWYVEARIKGAMKTIEKYAE